MSVLAIDISPLQGAHRMRGIGQTLSNIISNLDQDFKNDNRLVLFMERSEIEDTKTLSMLNLGGVNYEVRYLNDNKTISFRLPGKLRYINSALRQFSDIKGFVRGNKRVGSLKGIDVYLQIDQSTSLPKKNKKTKKVLMIHDLIPYVLEWDYLWNYSTAKQRGYSWKGALICAARRKIYHLKIKSNTSRADLILANSEATKIDFRDQLRVRESKIVVTPLGVNSVILDHKDSNSITSTEYRETSWGYLPKKIRIETKDKFLLYVGGVDPRRKVEDIVAAFNMMRARGEDVKLILLGDTLQGVNSIANEDVKRALLSSSYLEYVIFLGFADEDVREWLYRHALAFVFPSRYEGFGLPVLEAMRYGTRVISYKNHAVLEVAGDYPVYANGPLDICVAATSFIKQDVAKRKDANYVDRYSWAQTSSHIMQVIFSK